MAPKKKRVLAVVRTFFVELTDGGVQHPQVHQLHIACSAGHVNDVDASLMEAALQVIGDLQNFARSGRCGRAIGAKPYCTISAARLPCLWDVEAVWNLHI